MIVHERIRQFNTRDAYPEQKRDNDLCQTVVAKGMMVFVCGQVGRDLDSSDKAWGSAAPPVKPRRLWRISKCW